MEELNKKWQSQMHSRLKFIKWAVILFVAILFARLIYIQFYDAEIEKQSIRVHKNLISKQPIHAKRGRILSADRSVLATTVERMKISFDMGSHGFDNQEKFADQADTLSKLLSLYFGQHGPRWYADTMLMINKRVVRRDSIGFNVVDRRSLFGKLFNCKKGLDTTIVYNIKRSHTTTNLFGLVDANEWAEISQYPILNGSMGQVFHDSMKFTRIYPHGDLARRVIGRTGVNTPYGIEYAYRDSIRGVDGNIYLQQMAPNFRAKIENDTIKTTPAIDGVDIITTLDMELQDVADRALRQSLEQQEGLWGTTVVMECATGDILAMVNLRRNSKGGYTEGINYAVAQTMEPGSTIKLATTIALLDYAHMSPNKKYNSGYGRKVNVGKYNSVADSHPIGTRKNPSIDLKTAFAESANVYFLKAVIDNFKGRETEYYSALCSLYLDRHPGLTELEKSPNKVFLPKPGSAKWYGSTLGLLSYGYGLEITPMQTLTLYNAVANNGVMVAPRLVKSFERDGSVISEVPVKVLREQVCTPTTLALVREYMEQVALTGTAKSFFSEDEVPFRVGAKTGTATAAKGEKYGEGYHLGSMVTYLPAEAPRYTFITAIYKKKGKGSIFGATVAGPVQKQIATYLYNREEQWAETLMVGDVKQLPIDVKGGSIEHIGNVASHFDLAMAYTSPTGWGTTKTGINSITINSTTADKRLVPDVMGMGLSDALFLLENRGMKVTFSGSGKVVYQSVKAGEVIHQGDRIKIKLE